MSSILPLRSEPKTGGQDPRVVDLDGDEADAVFSALSSGTAREIISVLHGDPKTQSEIADAIDTSVQNVRYHLDKLEDAGLVEVVDTWYSSRGNEMKVYAPADAALIVSGDEGRAARLKAAISRLVGGVGVVALASLLVQTIADRVSNLTIGLGASGSAQDAPAGGGEDQQMAEETVQEEALTETRAGEMDGAGGAAETETGTVAGGDGGTEGTPYNGDRGTLTADGAGNESVEKVNVTYNSDLDNSSVELREAPGGEPNATVSESTDVAVETVTAGDVTVEQTTTEVAVETTARVTESAAAPAGFGLSPGMAFFLGGVSVLVVVVAIWYYSSY